MMLNLKACTNTTALWHYRTPESTSVWPLLELQIRYVNLKVLKISLMAGGIAFRR
jgi:hypothetical protein